MGGGDWISADTSSGLVVGMRWQVSLLVGWVWLGWRLGLGVGAWYAYPGSLNSRDEYILGKAS